MNSLTIAAEEWPLAQEFRIARTSKTAARVVYITITCDEAVGHGECLPYPRYSESTGSVVAQIEQVRDEIEAGCDRPTLQRLLPPGAARNALDCALLDLECKQTGFRAWQVLNTATPEPIATAYTLSMDDPDSMAVNATQHAGHRLLKLKLGPVDAMDCVRAVRRAAPDSRLIVDANEAWTLQQFERVLDEFAACDVEMIEQPLPAGEDEQLHGLKSPVLLGADESCHTGDDVERLADCYQVLNIKLDKTGGLTEALRLKTLALSHGLDVMVGCMVATSLSMAPATILTPGARFVDLDGPLLLKKDRTPGLEYQADRVFPPGAALWG